MASATQQLNVFGKPLKMCCTNPMTGFKRNGFCETIREDYGTHTVCAVVTDVFLQQQKSLGNDLVTAHPGFSFPGLKAGDRWCLCALRWKQAKDAGIAPKIDLEATNTNTLKVLDITLDELKAFAIQSNQNGNQNDL